MDAESFRESRDELDRPFVVIVYDGMQYEHPELDRVHCVCMDRADTVIIDSDTDGDYSQSFGPDGKWIDSTGWAWLELPAELRYSE